MTKKQFIKIFKQVIKYHCLTSGYIVKYSDFDIWLEPKNPHDMFDLSIELCLKFPLDWTPKRKKQCAIKMNRILTPKEF